MNTNSAIKDGLGGSGFHGYGHALNDFAGVFTDHMNADHPITFAVDNQFHIGAFLSATNGVLHRAKVRFKHGDVAILLLGLLFRETAGANIRLTKNGGGNGVVINLGGLIVIVGFGKGHTLCQCHRSQLHTAGNVTESIDAAFTGLEIVIDLNPCRPR